VEGQASLRSDDEQNTTNVSTIDDVDAQNAAFYGKFPFPWQPVSFSFPSDPTLAAVMLCQNLGNWTHTLLPSKPEIWVAGCGTNQAVQTALAFPHANILGTDLSQQSIDICADVARGICIQNLTLKRESINQARYDEMFDLVLCTGVIHHTADPGAALRVLARALKPSGILELMVYNRFHRITTSVAQKAIRLMNPAGKADVTSAVDFACRVIADLPPGVLLRQTLGGLAGRPKAMIADILLQPVEYSYTVESLAELADQCQLDLLVPCINENIKASGYLSWNMDWSDPELRQCYDSFDDLTRWQITNLLKMESSPMLWFYLSHRGHDMRQSEAQIAERFLDTTFVKTNATQRQYLRQGDGRYVLSPRILKYTMGPDAGSIGAIIDAVDGDLSMRQVFTKLGIKTDFRTAHNALLRLTTPPFPFLKAVHS
jgi:SAM-dependent methyltransferase